MFQYFHVIICHVFQKDGILKYLRTWLAAITGQLKGTIGTMESRETKTFCGAANIRAFGGFFEIVTVLNYKESLFKLIL